MALPPPRPTVRQGAGHARRALAVRAALACALVAASGATATAPFGTIIYTLEVRQNGPGASDELQIRAGQDPILTAHQFCSPRGLDCSAVFDHLCAGDAQLMCRSQRTVLADPTVVGFARVQWRGSEGSQECDMAIHLLRADADKAIEVGPSDFTASLVRLHCGNFARHVDQCFCNEEVRQVLTDALAKEVLHYRWGPQSHHYARLGLQREAEPEQIRRAFRRVSLDLHPDRQRGGGSDADLSRFLLAREAYEILSDPAARLQYDRQEFGLAFVAETRMPTFQAQASAVFGNSVSVAVDSSGNIKIVF